MRVIKVMGVICALVMSGQVWAQGSKAKPVKVSEEATVTEGGTVYPPGEPAVTAMVPVTPSVWSGTVFIGGRLGKHIRAMNYGPGSWIVDVVEFVDERGNVTKAIKGPRADDVLKPGEQRIEAVFANGGTYVGVLKWTEESEAESVYEDPMTYPHDRYFFPRFQFLYLDVEGKELWRTGVCCAKPGSYSAQIKLADDGSVVAIMDKRGYCSGDREHDIPAPAGCVGLRIYSSEGKEIHREMEGDYGTVSPNGKFVVFFVLGEWKSLNVKTGKIFGIPKVKESGPWSVTDEGVVRYYDEKWSPEWKTKYEYVPGKGLRKKGEK